MFRQKELRETAITTHALDVSEGTEEEFFDTFKAALGRTGKQVLVAR